MLYQHVILGFLYRIANYLLLLSITISLSSNTLAKQAPSEPEILFSLPEVALPKFAQKGEHNVGVKTITVTNPNQLVIPVNNQITAPLKRAARVLTVEVWYPAQNKPKQTLATYQDTPIGGEAFVIQGEAFRDAPARQSRYPLVVLSHGYNSYRTSLYHIGEHLASHGYIVASASHTGHTSQEANAHPNIQFYGFVSALFNQSRDQQFILDFFANKQHFLSEQTDTNKATIIGHSIGGMGVMNTIGGCYQYTPQILQTIGFPNEAAQTLPPLLNSCAGGKQTTDDTDRRWQAAVAIAPWGAQNNIFNQQDIASIQIPTLLITGSIDDVSGYEKGVKTIYDSMQQQDRYMLVYQNARHQIGVHPPLRQSTKSLEAYSLYAEGAWNVEIIANINKHFMTAFLACYIKNIKDYCSYLQLPFSSNQTTMDNGQLRAPWKGFPNKLSVGMEWHQP